VDPGEERVLGVVLGVLVKVLPIGGPLAVGEPLLPEVHAASSPQATAATSCLCAPPILSGYGAIR